MLILFGRLLPNLMARRKFVVPKRSIRHHKLTFSTVPINSLRRNIMPVIRKYLQDTYLAKDKAIVTATGRDSVGFYLQLSQTIFHPQGGGQPSDKGTINGVDVKAVSFEGDEIKHYVNEMPCNPGDEVVLVINQDERFSYAALHSAGHLMAGIVMEKYGLSSPQGHHFPGEARVKFKVNSKAIPTKEEIEKVIEDAIQKKLSIATKGVDNNRIVTIQGYPDTKCGGTHLSTTAEIRKFSIRNIKYTKKDDMVSFGYDAQYDLSCKPSEDSKQTLPATSSNFFQSSPMSAISANSEHVSDLNNGPTL